MSKPVDFLGAPGTGVDKVDKIVGFDDFVGQAGGTPAWHGHQHGTGGSGGSQSCIHTPSSYITVRSPGAGSGHTSTIHQRPYRVQFFHGRSQLL